MAAAYSKKTNSDLTEILKSRGLPHTGKKADMVARLVEADKADAEKTGDNPTPTPAAAATTAPASSAAPPKVDPADDVIDWDDDATPLEPATTTTTTTAADAAVTEDTGASNVEDKTVTAAGGKGAVANPVAVPNQKVDVDPSTTHDLTVTKPEDKKGEEETKEVAADKGDANGTVAEKTEENAEEKAAKSYSIGLATTDLDAELEKRRKRAEKFGIVEDTVSKESQKAAERAKRFGTAKDAPTSIVKGLDQALPEQSKKRGRGGEDGADNQQRGGKRRNFSGHGNGTARPRGRNGANNNSNNNNNHRRGRNNDKGSSNGKAKADNMSEQDRAALEKRRARFG